MKGVKGDYTVLKRTSEELLSQALAKCLETTSVEKLSVRQITEMAGVSRQTFYKKYVDKYDLINQNFYNILEETYSKIGDEYSLRAFFMHKYSILAEHRLMLQSAMSSRDYNSLAAFTHHRSYEFYKEKYKARGLVITEREDQLLDIYCYTIVYIIGKWIQARFSYTPEAMAELLIDAIPEGLTTFFTQLSSLSQG